MMKWLKISIIGTPEETTERMRQKHYLKKKNKKTLFEKIVATIT